MHYPTWALAVLLATGAAGLLAHPAAAQGESVGPEITINTDPASSAPDVAVAVDESWTAVWYGSGAAGSGIYSRTFSAAGVPSPPVRVDVAPNTGTLPVIARESAGYVVAWRSPGAGALSNITARRLGPDGTPRGAPFRVATGAPSLGTRIALSAAPDGRFVATWGDEEIYFQLVSASDVPQGNPVQVAPPRSGLELGNRRPAVAMFDSGGFVVVWTYDSGAIGARTDIRAKTFFSDGTLTSGPFVVNTFTTKLQFDPSVSATPTGSYVVTWTSEDTASQVQDGSGSGVYGNNRGEFRLNDYIQGPQYASDVAVTTAGDFVGVWTSDGQDGSGSGIFGARYRADGSRVGVEFRANTVTAGSQSLPAVAVSPGGRAVIVWTDASASRVVAVRTRVDTAVENEPPASPTSAFTVSPSPAGPSGSTAQFETATSGPVRLSVVDVLGREVSVVVAGEVVAGTHTYRVGTASLAPGIYVVRLVRGAALDTHILTVTR